MRKIYETPEIMVTRFDLEISVMDGTGNDNEGPGDGWNAGIESSGGNSDELPLFNFE